MSSANFSPPKINRFAWSDGIRGRRPARLKQSPLILLYPLSPAGFVVIKIFYKLHQKEFSFCLPKLLFHL